MCANQLIENRLKRLNAGLTNLFCQVTSDGATTTWSCILLLWLQTEILFDCGVIEMWNTVDKSNANKFGHTDRVCHFILIIQITVSAMIKLIKIAAWTLLCFVDLSFLALQHCSPLWYLDSTACFPLHIQVKMCECSLAQCCVQTVSKMHIML